MEFELTVTVANYGTDPVHGERFLHGLCSAYPGVSVVIDQDTIEDTLTASAVFEAGDFCSDMCASEVHRGAA